ncbi:MAG: hypothetical protein WDW38_004960 [Sanguina aurantia]
MDPVQLQDLLPPDSPPIGTTLTPACDDCSREAAGCDTVAASAAAPCQQPSETPLHKKQRTRTFGDEVISWTAPLPLNAGHLIATFGKLMLFGLDRMFPLDHIFSASGASKLECFERLKLQSTTLRSQLGQTQLTKPQQQQQQQSSPSLPEHPSLSHAESFPPHPPSHTLEAILFLAIGDGSEEASAARLMRWPFLKIRLPSAQPIPPSQGTASFPADNASDGAASIAMQHSTSDSNNPSAFGFPKFGRVSQSHAAQPVTKQRSLLSQSLLSAEIDKDRRRCKQEQTSDLSSAEHSDLDEETSLNLDEELEAPSCCSGTAAMHISRRSIKKSESRRIELQRVQVYECEIQEMYYYVDLYLQKGSEKLEPQAPAPHKPSL